MMMQRNGGRRQPSASGKTVKPSSSQRPENMEQKTAHDREKETAENPGPKPGSSKGRVEQKTSHSEERAGASKKDQALQ